MKTRWASIKSLFGELADLSVNTRGRKLDELSDSELALKVGEFFQRLDAADGGFLASSDTTHTGVPLPEAPPRFRPGDRLADRFEVIQLLGRGGMGEVYAAEDVSLGVRVALKTLRAGADPHGPARLRREIQLARRITHPNVCRIHDLFQHRTSDGEEVLLLSMELVEGETLHARLRRTGALPVTSAEPLLRQLLAGLEAAHRAGIVHRDLKPLNIMFCSGDGGAERLVIMDFGLARPQLDSGASLTRVGALAGTLDYMAPEQLRGVASPESDIYAVGLIAFEMLTGERPFASEYALESALKRLTELPRRPRQVSCEVPWRWERTILTCLERDPAQRFHKASEILAVLDGSHANMFGALRYRWCQARKYAVGAAALAVVGALAFGIVHYEPFLRGGGGASLVTLAPLTKNAGVTEEARMTRDGAHIAFASDYGSNGGLELWVQDGLKGAPRRITSDGFDKSEPSFSPNGSLLVFRSEEDGGGLYIMPAGGGAARLIAPAGRGGRFSPDGRSIAYWVGDLGEQPVMPARIYIVPASGGAPRRVEAGFLSMRHPVWFPDGRHLLFEGVRDRMADYSRTCDWYVLDTVSGRVSATGALARLRRRNLTVYEMPGNIVGHTLLFAARGESSGNIYAASFDPGTFHLSGDFRQLTSATDLLFAPWQSETGTLLVSGRQGSMHIWEKRRGRRGFGTRRQVTASEWLDLYPTLSADGRFLAFARSVGGERDVYVQDFASAADPRQVPLPVAAKKYWPVISPDGSRLAFAIGAQQGSLLYSMGTAPPYAARILCRDCGNPTGWSADGRALLTTGATRDRVFQIDTRTLEQSTAVLGNGSEIGEAQFSPDGQWIAFSVQTAADRFRVFVTHRYDGHAATPADWIPVTSTGSWSARPHWMPDGRTLVFLSTRDGRSCIWTQSLDAGMHPQGRAVELEHFASQEVTPAQVSHQEVNLAAGGARLVFNAGGISGNVWTGSLGR